MSNSHGEPQLWQVYSNSGMKTIRYEKDVLRNEIVKSSDSRSRTSGPPYSKCFKPDRTAIATCSAVLLNVFL